MIVDRSWKIVYANAEAIRMSMIPVDRLGTETLWQIFPRLRGSENEAMFRRAMESGEPCQFETFHPRSGLWFEVDLRPTDDGLVVLYHDITPTRESLEREAAATRRARQVYEAAPDCIVLIDREFRFSFANQRALELLGEPTLVGQNIFDLFPGNREEPYGSTYRRAMLDRIPGEFEAWHGAPLLRWLKVSAQPYEDGIIVFFSDITARKEAEMREQEMARQLAQVLDVTSDAVISFRRDWTVAYLNKKARQLIDPAGTLVGRNHWGAFPAAKGNAVWNHYQETMEQGVPTDFEAYYPEPLNAWFALQARPSPDGIVVFFRDITAERQQQRDLRQQQVLLTEVQHLARVATWELDPVTGAIVYGPGSFEVFGRPLAELANVAAFRAFLPTEHEAGLRKAFKRALKTRDPIIVEFPLTQADGSLLWIESRGQAVLEGDGAEVPRTIRLRGMSIDVTARRMDQEELVASEARYRVLADLNPQAIWMGDAQGSITYANQGFLSYLGKDREDLPGLGWLTSFAPEHQQRVRSVWMHSVTTGCDYDLEAPLWHAATETYRWWHLRAAPVRDPSGNILHWLGVGQDIHDQKTAAELLRQKHQETTRQHAELETIYKTSPVGLALLDPVDFRFLNLNDREAEILGYPKEYLIGRPFAEIAPIPGLLDLFRSVAAGNAVKSRLLEGELTARPGERRAWSVNYSPLYDEQGNVRAISTASIEITDQRRAETALVQSEKLAAVGRLASSISHEINNPLEAVTNLLYLMSLDTELPERLKEYVATAQSELSRVSQIVTQTLRFHRQAMAPTLVTPADLVSAVIRLYTGRLANSNIVIDAVYQSNTRLLCFENDIRQVLNNLIANAIDAMRRGGRLIIRAHDATDGMRPGARLTGIPQVQYGVETPTLDTAPRRGVRITIADTGHGMSEATVARAFEPFFTTKDLNGTGLGLWISAGIVERHQGRLRVRSSDRPDRHYTVFTLFLPLRESAKEEARRIEEPPSRSQAVPLAKRTLGKSAAPV